MVPFATRAILVSFEDVGPGDKRQHLSARHEFFRTYQGRAEDDKAEGPII